MRIPRHCRFSSQSRMIQPIIWREFLLCIDFSSRWIDLLREPTPAFHLDRCGFSTDVPRTREARHAHRDVSLFLTMVILSMHQDVRCQTDQMREFGFYPSGCSTPGQLDVSIDSWLPTHSGMFCVCTLRLRNDNRFPSRTRGRSYLLKLSAARGCSHCDTFRKQR